MQADRENPFVVSADLLASDIHDAVWMGDDVDAQEDGDARLTETPRD